MIALLKLSPIILLTGLMINGMNVLMAAPIATMYAAIVAMLTLRMKFTDVMNKAMDSVKEMIIVFFILMLAYGVTAKTVALVGFLVTCVLSVATGTSWGTFAACAPIFLWLNHIVGGDVLLTTAAIAGGACFGDNIGLISDTTVVSSGLQKVEVVHRVKHQGVWSLLCVVATAIVIFMVSASMGLPTVTGNAGEAINAIPQEAWDALTEQRPSAVVLLEQVKTGVPVYVITPLLIVLALAIKGFPTFICLGSGIISSLVFGLIAGTVGSVGEFLDSVQGGFESAGSWSIVMMMWIGAFGGIMSIMDAFDPVAKFIVRSVRNVRQLMFSNGLLCLLGNAALADEMAQIVTIGPIIKSITDENVEASEEDMYRLRLRNSAFGDAMGVFGSQLIPWHCYMGFYVAIAAAVYPLFEFTALGIIKYNFMAMIAVGSMLLLTLTGLDRFIPLFSLPSEPKVRLRKAGEAEVTKLEKQA